MPEPIVDADVVHDTKRPLLARIAEAMAEAQAVAKDKRNTQANYNYASVEAVLAEVRAPLFHRGILLMPHPQEYTEEAITSKGGGHGIRLILKVDFEFVDGETGDTYRVKDWRGEAEDYNGKVYGKAFTDAVKTFCRIGWLLPTNADEGGPGQERAVVEKAVPWTGDVRKLREAAGALLDIDSYATPVSQLLSLLEDDGEGTITHHGGRAIMHAAVLARSTRTATIVGPATATPEAPQDAKQTPEAPAGPAPDTPVVDQPTLGGDKDTNDIQF